MPAGGGKSTRISDAGSFLWLDPSPNGKTFLATGYKLNRIKLASEAVFHIDTASGKVIEVKAFDEVAFLVAWWSPDGHRIGCMKYDSDSANNRLGDSHLLILDADGKNEKTLLTIKGDHQKTRFLGWFSAAK